jgi:hypothetical protein
MTQFVPKTGTKMSGPLYGPGGTPTASDEYVTKSYVDGISGATPVNFVDKETPSGSINGSNLEYTLANDPDAGSEHIYLNGVLQKAGGADYSISADTITFITAPESGSTLLASYRYT